MFLSFLLVYQGEREVIGDLEEIVTSSQIVAQEGADAEPLVMRDKSKKKNKRRYGKPLLLVLLSSTSNMQDNLMS